MGYVITVSDRQAGRSRELVRVTADEADLALIAHLERQHTGSGDPHAAFARLRAHVLAKYAPTAPPDAVVG